MEAIERALDELEDVGALDEDVDARALVEALREGGRTERCARAVAATMRACDRALRESGASEEARREVVGAFGALGQGDDAVERAVAVMRRCAFERMAADAEADARADGPTAIEASGGVGDAMEVDETSERVARALERLAVGLAVADGATAEEVLEAAAARATAALAALPANHTERVLDASKWTAAQRELIERVERALHDEYKARREMVCTRAQVTTTSFCYSPRLNALKHVREDFARRVVSELHIAPQVTMDDVCDARYADLAMAGIKVTAGSEGLQSAVKKVMMGAVPDRGGRTDGSDRATTMPAFKERTDEPAGGGGRGGGGRGGGGRGGGREGKSQEQKKKKGGVRW